MVKKLVLVTSVILLVAELVACSNADTSRSRATPRVVGSVTFSGIATEPAVDITEYTEEPVMEEVTEQPVLEEPANTIKFDKSFKKKVKAKLEKYSCVDIVQSTSNNLGEKDEQSVLIRMDCTNEVCYVKLDMRANQGVLNDSYEYVSDFKSDDYFMKKGKKWVEQEGNMSVLNVSTTDLKNTYDVYREFITGVQPKNGVKNSKDVIEFTKVTQAVEGDLSSNDYDSLGNKTITVGYKDYKPVYYKSTIEYIVSGVNNSVCTEVRFKNYSNKKLNARKLMKQYK